MYAAPAPSAAEEDPLADWEVVSSGGPMTSKDAVFGSAFIAELVADGDLEVDMTGRLCLVTGGNSGLGLATARGLAERGATVWIELVVLSRLQLAAWLDVAPEHVEWASVAMQMANFGQHWVRSPRAAGAVAASSWRQVAKGHRGVGEGHR